MGNDHDQVGRGFHDHLSYPTAVLTGPARAKLLDWFGPILAEEGVTRTAKLEASPALRQRLGLLNVMAHLSIDEPPDSGAAVVRSLLQSVQRGEFRAALRASLAKLPPPSLDIARLAYDARYHPAPLRLRRARPSLCVSIASSPRGPTTASGWTIRWTRLASPERLSTGASPRKNARSLRAFALFLRSHLPQIGVPPIAWQPELDAPDPDAPLTGITDTYHPMGGAIMGTHPATSVVAPDLHVHGVPNLSVASCATFPAGGSSNPTFTLMALTLRLAERLAHSRNL